MDVHRNRVGGDHVSTSDYTQPTLPFGEPKARRTDPHTSQLAADTIKIKAGSQRARLLIAFADHAPAGLTDEEAALAAGIPLTSEYATRCSELRNAALIGQCFEHTDTGPTPATRISSSGLARIVSAITDDGLTAAERLTIRPLREAS